VRVQGLLQLWLSAHGDRLRLRLTAESLSARGVTKVITDNGGCYRSFQFRDVLGDVRHRFTRSYRPQTNGKV
jgi:transposase InsO family protein